MNLAVGEDWRQAKFAARYLAFCKSRATSCLTLAESIAGAMTETDSELPASYLTPWTAQLGSYQDVEDLDIDWIEDEDVDETLQAELLALKTLEIATPVLRLLATLAEHEGTLNPEVAEERTAQSRLRLQAAVSLLHLSTVETFSNAISPKFISTEHLSHYGDRALATKQTAAEVESVTFPHSIGPASQIISRMPRAVKVECLETIFIRYLHLLAHHPDYGTGQLDEIVEMAGYIQFYLDLIASSENISLLYHLAQKGKTVRDPESHGSSQNFYIMSEVAQILIKARAQQNSWLLASYPGKVRLPADILRPLPNVEVINRILKTVYLLSAKFAMNIFRIFLYCPSVCSLSPKTKPDGQNPRIRRIVKGMRRLIQRKMYENTGLVTNNKIKSFLSSWTKKSSSLTDKLKNFAVTAATTIAASLKPKIVMISTQTGIDDSIVANGYFVHV
ncbi:hypothetical protein BDN70DRAFT_899215 [Pholiota conissans]|uniref:Uncharacterized protein n=1 Tax=Pholiota conissans TaxID=109636 RepID=A0A9P5YS77_9AGAR|nr:hypothetical protein BDN70DRAFT_899215 [Pholiota conissans]